MLEVLTEKYARLVQVGLPPLYSACEDGKGSCSPWCSSPQACDQVELFDVSGGPKRAAAGQK